MSTGGAFTLAEKRESRLYFDCLYHYARQLEQGLGNDLMRHSLLYAGDRMLPSEFVNLIQNKMAGMEEALGGPGPSPAPGEESLIDIDVKSFKVVSRAKAPSTASSANRVKYTLQLPPALASVGNIVHVSPCHNATLDVIVAAREPLPWETRKRSRPDDPDWDNDKRIEALKAMPIAKLVSMTDAAARLGAEVNDQSTFDAWGKLLSQNNPEAKKEAQRVFDKELSLPAPPPPGEPGRSQTTAGAVLDGLVEAGGASA